MDTNKHQLGSEQEKGGEDARPTEKRVAWSLRRRWWVAFAVVLVVVCAVWFFSAGPDPGSATVLNDRSAFENRVTSAMNRLPGGLRNLLRKIKGKIVGPARLVLIDVFVVHFPEAPSISGARELDVRGKGGALRVLAIPATNSESFRKVLGQIKGSRVLASQQMSAFSGQFAQLSTFANPLPGIYAGHTVDVLPRARQGVIDVAIHAEAMTPMMSDSGSATGTATNVFASVRVDVQPQTGVLLLASGLTGASTGVFVLPTMFRLKQ